MNKPLGVALFLAGVLLGSWNRSGSGLGPGYSGGHSWSLWLEILAFGICGQGINLWRSQPEEGRPAERVTEADKSEGDPPEFKS